MLISENKVLVFYNEKLKNVLFLNEKMIVLLLKVGVYLIKKEWFVLNLKLYF